MFVIKRNGSQEPVMFDKITGRIKKLCYGLDVEPVLVTMKVVSGVYNGVTTSQLDELAAETAAYMCTNHPDYGLLAARISVSNLHKNTEKSFSKTIDALYNYVEPKTGLKAPLIAEDVYKIIMDNKETLDSAVIYDRDFKYDYFGFKTLERSYLLKITGKIAERPQQMLMRVAVGIHKNDIAAAIETYNLMSEKWFTHASPTMFNAGTPRPQLSSCFLVAMQSDSIEGIYDTLKQCAVISKSAGGIGVHIHKIRATNSYIRGTNGNSNGIIPMLRVFNDTARYVDQGGGKRKGAFAVYLEPWHADIFDFLDLRKNHGKEENRARDLFYGLWIPDLFMKRVESNGNWSLMCPHECPGLDTSYGAEFETLFVKYENEGKVRRTLKAQELWFAILQAQIETGNPYMLYKDACNSKSNQQNLGTIMCSNLCTEIIQYTSPEETAVCNLASISLPRFVKDSVFDFQKLYDITYIVTKNLNKVIDVNYYPVKQAERSNQAHRPIGLGVQGLADAFIKMRFPFDSADAEKLNVDIFETIYFAALNASLDLAKRDGPYSSYQGSPMSQGKFQFDLWGVKPTNRWDWDNLRAQIKQHGIRNSLLVAPMPTASTSQILGNNECFEPYTSNIYTRRVLAGEFVVVNRRLLKDLMKLNLWNDKMRNLIISKNGSVAGITEIPEDLRAIYKTVWEIPQRKLVDMAAARGAYIDQSQSFNVFLIDANFGKLTSLHFYAWKKGLKTGMYYLRTQAAAQAIQFTVDPTQAASSSKTLTEGGEGESKARAQMVCSLQNKDECLSCGS